VARNVFLVLCTISVCLAASEGILRLSGTAENLGLIWHRGRTIEATPPMLQLDAEYGYSYKPNGSYRYVMRRDGQLIYDVTYTIDAHGGRATLPANDGRIAVMLGGESFHFSEGLHDHQTLAHHLQLRSRLHYALTQAWTSLAPTPDGRLFVAILRRIQELAAQKYGARVLMVYYPGHTTYNDYVGRRDVYHRLFAEAGVTYIDVSLAIPDIDASYYIPGDGHPSEKMNVALADIILKATGIPVE
jgi:hypothetical protein